jgi:hypothetical protein
MGAPGPGRLRHHNENMQRGRRRLYLSPGAQLGRLNNHFGPQVPQGDVP